MLSKNIVSILTALLVALFLRLLGSNQSFWLDEATSVLVARDFSYSEIITKFSPGDFHPPLYYLLLKVWIGLVGSGEVAVRMLSIIFGVATVYVTYAIGKNVYSRFVGLIAAMLLATSPLHIYYSHEARMYSLETLLASVCVLAFVRILTAKRPSVLSFALFSMSCILLIYTDYLPVLLFGSFVFFLLISKQDYWKKYKKAWLYCGFVIFLSVLPWLPIFLNQLKTGLLVKSNAYNWWKVLGKTNLKELALVPIKFMIGRISFADKTQYGLVVLTSLLIFAVPVSIAIKRWRETKFILSWLLIPIMLAALLGTKLSVFSYFRLVFVLPAFYVLLAYGLLKLKNKNVGLLLGLGILFIHFGAGYIYANSPRFHRENWRGAVQYVEQSSKENALSLFVTNNQRDAYRYYSKSIPSSGPGALDSNPPNKIWFFRYVQPIFDPEEKTKAKIEQLGYTKVKEHDFNGVVVWEYER